MKVIYEPKGRAAGYAKYACNLYRGCGHKCFYCYAPNVIKMDRQEFYNNPQPRKGVIDSLKYQAKKMGDDYKNDGYRFVSGDLEKEPDRPEVFLCFTTDPYQPINEEHQLTRQAIEILHTNGLAVNILTKGKITDFDLLAKRPDLSKVGVPVNNSAKIILDLCGGTGAWSKPYKDAGYDVRLITLPDIDVRQYIPPKDVYGILAAPPCTHFSGSGAQYWKEKDRDGRTLEALSITDACLRIILMKNPVFWALENPVGRLRKFLGADPDLIFNPCDYGDPYTKKTLLWGKFNMFEKNPVEPIKSCKQGSWVQKLGGKSEKTKRLRATTPPGFAKAFYEANK